MDLSKMCVGVKKHEADSSRRLPERGAHEMNRSNCEGQKNARSRPAWLAVPAGGLR